MRPVIIFFLIFLTASSGCSTISTMQNPSSEDYCSKRDDLFSGVREDLHTLHLAQHYSHNPVVNVMALYALVDLPFSAAADLCVAPFELYHYSKCDEVAATQSKCSHCDQETATQTGYRTVEWSGHSYCGPCLADGIMENDLAPPMQWKCNISNVYAEGSCIGSIDSNQSDLMGI